MLIVDGLHYFNYTAAKFNHDVIQLPFWALAGFAFHRALRGRQMTDWLLLGLAVGMSLWAKYFVVVLVGADGAVRAGRPRRAQGAGDAGPLYRGRRRARSSWRRIWSGWCRTTFLPFAYAEHRAVLPRGWYDHLWHPLQFAVGQLVLPAAVAG